MARLISDLVNVTVASTPYTPVKNAPLKGVKFKTPPIESEELDRFYDIVFAPDSFCATWAGRDGHYMYGKEPHQIASNQDGYVYLWFSDFRAWTMSADSKIARLFCREFVEINI